MRQDRFHARGARGGQGGGLDGFTAGDDRAENAVSGGRQNAAAGTRRPGAEKYGAAEAGRRGNAGGRQSAAPKGAVRPAGGYSAEKGAILSAGSHRPCGGGCRQRTPLRDPYRNYRNGRQSGVPHPLCRRQGAAGTRYPAGGHPARPGRRACGDPPAAGPV